MLPTGIHLQIDNISFSEYFKKKDKQTNVSDKTEFTDKFRLPGVLFLNKVKYVRNKSIFTSKSPVFFHY